MATSRLRSTMAVVSPWAEPGEPLEQLVVRRQRSHEPAGPANRFGNGGVTGQTIPSPSLSFPGASSLPMLDRSVLGAERG
jgi:hypothetical protein